MIVETLLFLILLLAAPPTHAAVSITAVDLYVSADACIQNCASSQVFDQYYNFGCNDYNNGAKCLCDVPGRYSDSMNNVLSMCVVTAPCYDPSATSMVTAIFSAYCSSNGVGANAVAAVTTASGSAVTSNPKVTPSTGASATRPQSTSTAIQTSSSSSSSTNTDTSTNSWDLSTSDKVAIICAVGGAIVTIIVGVGSWKFKQKRAQKAQAAAAAAGTNRSALDSEAGGPVMRHGQPQMTPLQTYSQMQNHQHNHNMSMPLYHQQQGWGWQGGK